MKLIENIAANFLFFWPILFHFIAEKYDVTVYRLINCVQYWFFFRSVEIHTFLAIELGIVIRIRYLRILTDNQDACCVRRFIDVSTLSSCGWFAVKLGVAVVGNRISHWLIFLWFTHVDDYYIFIGRPTSSAVGFIPSSGLLEENSEESQHQEFSHTNTVFPISDHVNH